MPNIDLGVRDGGSYQEDVFFARVVNSGVSRDWWVATDAWSALVKDLLATEFDVPADRDRVGKLIRSLDRDLPAEAEVRFPASAGAPGTPGFRRLVFYRVPQNIKSLFTQMLSATHEDSLYHVSVASLDTAVLQVYNQTKFESEFGLTWYLHPSLLLASAGGSSSPTATGTDHVEAQLQGEISRLRGELDTLRDVGVVERTRLLNDLDLVKADKARLEMELGSTRAELGSARERATEMGNELGLRNVEMGKLQEELGELQNKYEAAMKKDGGLWRWLGFKKT